MTTPTVEAAVRPPKKSFKERERACSHPLDGLDYDEDNRLFCTECMVRFKPVYTEKGRRHD